MDALINIDVADLSEAERFYCTALSLSPGRRFGAFGVELLGCSAPIYLLAKAAGSRPSPTTSDVRDYSRHWTPVHIDFVVENIERASAKAVAAGATLEAPISTHAWGKLARMSDPFGNGFCLVELVGDGYDAIADRPGEPAG